MATEGVLFENHISSTSWTLPTHEALFTSVVDSVHGCLSRDQGLPDDLDTMAERFVAAASRNVMGHSLVSLMTKQGRFIETPAISELFSMGRDMRSLRTRRWKYIDDRRDNLKYFFDLTNDPREQHRLQTWNTKSGRKTRTSYDQAFAMIKAHAANPPTTDASRSLPDDVVEQLKTLGYVAIESDYWYDTDP